MHNPFKGRGAIFATHKFVLRIVVFVAKWQLVWGTTEKEAVWFVGVFGVAKANKLGTILCALLFITYIMLVVSQFV